MELDPQQCYDALCARDRRFDGRFFVGVSSTGVYCRPVCAVRTPRREHCSFHPSAAAAEKAGFRPCLRCRPELAPGWGLPDIPGRLAQAAAQLIGQGFLDHGGTEALAARVGVSSRHLRRLFRAEYGVSMLELAQTQRLLLAKQCLTQTAMPVADVALACGFGSVRRFHAALRQRWGLRAQQIRRDGAAARTPGTLQLALGYRPPLAWQAWLDCAGAQAVAGVEQRHGARYTRSLRLRGRDGPCVGWLQAWEDAPRCTLRVQASANLAPLISQLLDRLRRMFDVGASPSAIDARLGRLAAQAPGLRVPGSPDGFETLLRVLLRREGREAARLLAGLAELFTSAAERAALQGAPQGLCRVLPDAATLADAGMAELLRCGLSAATARTLSAAAREVAAGRIELQPWAALEPTLQALRDLPGIDEASVQWVAMQALGWPDAFAADDPALQRACGCADAAALLAQAQCWRPWRAYAAMHLRLRELRAPESAPESAPVAAPRDATADARAAYAAGVAS